MPDQRRRSWKQTLDVVLRATGAVLLVSTACLTLLSLGWPYGPDHAIMTVVGRAWRLGAPPYAGFIDVKGPLAYVPYLLGDWLAGGSMVGIRVLDLSIVATTAYVCYHTLRTQIDRRVAQWSALLLVGICYRVGFIEGAQPDGWASFGVAIVYLLLWRHRERLPLHLFAAAGIATGMAALVKPQFAAFGALAILAAFLWPTAASRTRSLVTLTVGAVVPVIVMVGLLYAQGALDEMVEVATGSLMRTYLADRTLLPHTAAEWKAAIRFPLLLSYTPPLFLLAAIGLSELRHLDRRLAVALFAWSAGAFGLIVMQGRYFTYQWFPLLPPLCILAGLAIGRTLPRYREASSAALRVTVPAVITLSVMFFTLSFARRAGRDVVRITAAVGAGTPLVTAIRESVDPEGASRFTANVATAAFIAQHVGPQRVVGTWLYDASPLLLADVRPNSRLFFIHPVLTRSSAGADSIMQDQAAELHREAPRLLVIDCDATERDGKSPPERSPWLLAEVRANYTRVFASGGLRVYQHIDQTAPLTPPAGTTRESICPAAPH